MTKEILGVDIEGAYKKYVNKKPEKEVEKKSKDNLELKVTGSVVVPTPTKQDLLLLLIYTHKVGFVLGSQFPNPDNVWRTYEENTCLNLEVNKDHTKKLSHIGEVSWYGKHFPDKKIISISNYFKQNNVTKKQLEQYMNDYPTK